MVDHLRVVVDVYGVDDYMAAKESVAMMLEPLGNVRVVQVIADGKETRWTRM